MHSVYFATDFPLFEVRASAAFVPEFSNLQDESEKFVFAYSIRMSLSSDGCVVNGLRFSSCQLSWRHWIVRANHAVVSDVNGEAVIGKFPLLRPGEEEFVYESCASLPTSQGSIEGSFTFVPGRLADAKGSPFAVEVARFLLQGCNSVIWRPICTCWLRCKPLDWLCGANTLDPLNANGDEPTESWHRN
ncbi:F-box protein skip16 [Orobanche hederae]